MIRTDPRRHRTRRALGLGLSACGGNDTGSGGDTGAQGSSPAASPSPLLQVQQLSGQQTSVTLDEASSRA